MGFDQSERAQGPIYILNYYMKPIANVSLLKKIMLRVRNQNK